MMDVINKNNSQENRLTRVSCAVIFAAFTFVYLYWYQADLLTVTQHALSKGKTHYNHLVGAVVIIAVLQLLQVGITKLCRDKIRIKALTYIPSFLVLTALTSAFMCQSGDITFGFWTLGLPVLLLLCCFALWAVSAADFLTFSSSMPACRSVWINMLVLLLSMLMSCCFSNSDKTYHARIHMEQCMMNADYDGALATARSVCKPDGNITMLTAYSLSKKNLLGEKLFEYNVFGGSESLTPGGLNTKLCMLPDSSFYNYLGGWYVQRMSTKRYLDYQRRHGRLNKASVDYLLCSYLLDKKLDAFAYTLPRYYAINDSLPKHYKEALVLYVHKRANPRFVYENNVMNADFQDYQKIEHESSGALERQNKLRDTYGNTYWYYYQY